VEALESRVSWKDRRGTEAGFVDESILLLPLLSLCVCRRSHHSSPPLLPSFLPIPSHSPACRYVELSRCVSGRLLSEEAGLETGEPRACIARVCISRLHDLAGDASSYLASLFTHRSGGL
jgi:hypothetical protein